MNKALFFDIDGTLVNFQGQMPASTRRALRQVQKNGHRIVICTGRSVCQIYPWLLDMKFDGIIAATGAYVECDGQIIYEHHIEGEALEAVLTLLKRVDAGYWAQTKNIIVMTADSKQYLHNRFSSMELNKDITDQVWQNMQIDEQLGQRHDIEKFNFFDSQITIANIQKALSDYCDVTAMSFEDPTDNNGEITCKGINKSLGMQRYIEYTGIAREDTIAFGDGPNDLDMVEYAHVGTAMGNAIDDLKKRADYVTAGVDEDGIEYALQEFGLL